MESLYHKPGYLTLSLSDASPAFLSIPSMAITVNVCDAAKEHIFDIAVDTATSSTIAYIILSVIIFCNSYFVTNSIEKLLKLFIICSFFHLKFLFYFQFLLIYYNQYFQQNILL